MSKTRKSTRKPALKLEIDPRAIRLEEQSEIIVKKFPKPDHHIQPKTPNQEKLIKSIDNSEITIASGPAGVGKTYIVGGLASKFLSQGDVSTIVLTRANVGVGKSIGLLPGSIEEKMSPLLAPILNVLKERMGEGMYSYNMSKRNIQMQPIEYIRGRSFKDTFLVVDEAQNLTKEEVKALITRFESGRIIFLGDPFQHDLKGETGLEWLMKFSDRHDMGFSVVEFSLDDIVRSSLVKKFLTALYSETFKTEDKKQSAALLG